ncbi:hypothetical protein SPHINGOAX6_50170 [Sphingomonas sp. AX6]|nr:hypothetical protein SPHINGOAX6_50170 [Sphingomonas sp. AX6]
MNDRTRGCLRPDGENIGSIHAPESVPKQDGFVAETREELSVNR